MNKHIAFFTSSFNIGGVERAFITLANSFAQKGYRVDFLVCLNSGELQTQVDKSINIIDFDGAKLRHCFIKLHQYLKTSGVQTLITGPTYPNIVALICRFFLRNKAKIIISQHSYQDTEMEQLGIVGKIAPFLIKNTYNYADRIVAVSNGIKHDLIQNYNIKPQKITTIYNAVIDDSFHTRKKEKLDLSEEWFSEPYFVVVSRISSVKNIPFIIKSFATLKNTHLDLKHRLLIVGEGVEKKNLELLAVELGIANDVIFVGSVSNPLPIIKNAAMLLHASFFESMGIVYIEALALHVPVVTLSNDGANELLAKVPAAKIVLRANNSEQLFIKAILEMLSKNKDHSFPSLDEYTTDSITKSYMALIDG